MYITVSSSKRLATRKGLSNTPVVLSAKGLPDDDEDEDDFPIDLEQWNHMDAFQDFIFGDDDAAGCLELPVSLIFNPSCMHHVLIQL